jgi:glycosyltransferase involved in cell wall biosynthesis
MAAVSFSKFFSKNNANVDIDQRIAENIKQFTKTVPKQAVKAYSRPPEWVKKIEIVIPCYNHVQYLTAAFKSIAEQTRKEPITVTFVNDASSDNSLAVMENIKAGNRPNWIKVNVMDNPKNINQSASINKAISESSNQLFVILNSDDILTPDCLELIVSTYNKHSDIALLGGQSLWFEDETKLPKHTIKSIGQLRLKKYGPQDAINFTKLNDITLSQSSCSFFRSAWELVGGYFEKDSRVCSYDDRDFQMRVCSLLPIGVYNNYPMEFYRTVSSQGKATM